MAKQGYFDNWKRIKVVSFGLIYVLFLLWLIFHTGQFVPEADKDLWFNYLIGYGLLNALIFGVADVRNKLFDVKLVDFVPRFLIFFFGSLFVFYLLLTYVDPLNTPIFSLLSAVPTYLLILHAMVFATTESAVWQGFLDDKLGHPWSELSAGIFHYGIWTGSPLIVIPSAGLLFAGFSYVNFRFRNSKNDLVPAIASHTAFNFVKLGILLSVAR